MNDFNRPGGGRPLLMTLLHAAGGVQRRLERAVEQCGLSLAKTRVLQILDANGGTLPLGRLANGLSCVRSNVTQLVDRLEGDGLVRREPDPEDRRSTLAVITEEGQRRLEAAVRAQVEAEQQLLRDIPAYRREQLAVLLSELGTPPT